MGLIINNRVLNLPALNFDIRQATNRIYEGGALHFITQLRTIQSRQGIEKLENENKINIARTLNIYICQKSADNNLSYCSNNA